MLEIYDEEEGRVYGSCRCGDSINTPTPVTGGSTLPSTCFSPARDECDWYRSCLERRYPCEDADTGYAISYAEKFCLLYNERQRYFSRKGRLWVNAVRKCLQVALVPLLRIFENTTCADIKQTAFDSHSDCYVSPNNGPSICDLGCLDWAQVFWTIRSAFVDESVESMKGMVEVGGRCLLNFNPFDRNCPSVVTWAVIIYSLRPRGKRQLDDANNNERATAIAAAIAETQDWDSNDLGWYAYGVSSNSTHLHMMLLLGDLRGLRGAEPGTALPFGQNDTLTDLAEAISSGRLGVLNTRTGYAYVRELRACTDVGCTESYIRASSNATVVWPTSMAPRCLSNDIVLVALTSFALVFLRSAW